MSAASSNCAPAALPGVVHETLPPAGTWLTPTSRPATQALRQAALMVSLATVLVTAYFMPSARQLWPRFAAFIPAYQSAVIFCYLVTAYLVFAHFRATPNRALLHLGCASLYTGLVLIAQFLSFPGMFVDRSVLPGGAQTTIWLWFFWHLGPVVGMTLYVWREWRPGHDIKANPTRAMRRALIMMCTTLIASIALVTLFHDWLPVLDVNGDFSRITSYGIAPALQGIILITLLMLWRWTRFQTVLHVWVGVSLLALLCDNAITMAGGTRLSVGWYIGRTNALLSAMLLLLVYLHEFSHVFAQMAAHARTLAADKAKLEVAVDNARLDDLTGLPTRSLFLERVRLRLAQGAVASRGAALLYLDLDGFKMVNDCLGHARGDAVLKATADVLRMQLREDDLACRLGGDEFLAFMLAPHEGLEAAVCKVAQRVIAGVSEIGDGVGCSIGLVISVADHMELEQAIREADRAMYAAKREGRNHWHVYQLNDSRY